MDSTGQGRRQHVLLRARGARGTNLVDFIHTYTTYVYIVPIIIYLYHAILLRHRSRFTCKRCACIIFILYTYYTRRRICRRQARANDAKSERRAVGNINIIYYIANKNDDLILKSETHFLAERWRRSQLSQGRRGTPSSATLLLY